LWKALSVQIARVAGHKYYCGLRVRFLSKMSTMLGNVYELFRALLVAQSSIRAASAAFIRPTDVGQYLRRVDSKPVNSSNRKRRVGSERCSCPRVYKNCALLSNSSCSVRCSIDCSWFSHLGLQPPCQIPVSADGRLSPILHWGKLSFRIKRNKKVSRIRQK